MPEKSPRRKLYLLVALLAIISVFFLRDSYWQFALNEDEFIRLYAEVVKLQTRLADQPLKARLETERILDSAGATEAQLNRFIEQMNKEPERWVKIWEKINKELEKAGPAGDATLPKNR
ncbi:MAG: hypothetical protein L0Z48_10075 [candidate division Zixibacteria bacterium]|nr:hypothetical protein [candidate division Zixibacteria bacterium]MCI0596868.1 hypothetical protein [candidate division Zixibacteria bacterium]